MTAIPRFLVAAPSSGTGKTTVTLALLAALKKRGLNPVSFKCGPDYIDPMFHRAVLGIPSYNLDLFFTPAELLRGLAARHAEGRGAAVIEGVMGYYDGSGTGTKASSYEIAAVTETPAVLVVSADGAALSTAAVINGFKDFRIDSRIAGAILNGCSAHFFGQIKDVLERETGLPVLGYLPRMEDCALKSRHLGLVTAREIEDLQRKLDRLGDAAERCVDIRRLLDIAGTAPEIRGALPDVARRQSTGRKSAWPMTRLSAFITRTTWSFWHGSAQSLCPSARSGTPRCRRAFPVSTLAADIPSCTPGC
jgi:cobyrinic acid a,c-diamide synthase